MRLKLKALDETKSFYNAELKKKGLTETERDKYLSALKTIKRIIREKERSGENRKYNKFIA
ncbi:unnamed protein product [marine sediment metagenome]|uniref:Uncharacterized protein n=1 Tax=marine sediment metagenome TaxID=412755 RepID=X1RDH1_9ZZZZ